MSVTLMAATVVRFRMIYADPTIVDLTFHNIIGKWYAWVTREGSSTGQLELIPQEMMR